MKTTRIKIRNLFGLTDLTLAGKSVEITGPKGAGKSSVLDAIRYALTNRSTRDFIIRQGETEGEILIETDSGLSIDRTKRTTKADAIVIKDGSMVQSRPAEFLTSIFTPLQLNPVEFTQMSRQEKNREILNLVEFAWNMEWIKSHFGEIPQNVNYDQHILQVLADIQAENGTYFQSRQTINRDMRNKLALVEDIGKDIPPDYDAKKWQAFDLSAAYTQLERVRHTNGLIEKAATFAAGYDNKVRGIEADAAISQSAAEKAIASERIGIRSSIAALTEQIKSEQAKLLTLDGKQADKFAVIDADYKAAKSKLDADNSQAIEWAGKTATDTTELAAEVEMADRMKSHLNEYGRMVRTQEEVETLKLKSEAITHQIELARDLPGEILRTAVIPIDGLTVVDGIPLINGLPISNLSDGELISLCVDVTIQKPGSLQIILIDGAERLDSKSREELYAKCRDKGLTMIATRTTDSAYSKAIQAAHDRSKVTVEAAELAHDAGQMTDQTFADIVSAAEASIRVAIAQAEKKRESAANELEVVEL